MKTRSLKLITAKVLSLAAISFVAIAPSTGWSTPITITPGNPGNAGTDNVLFNDGNLLHSGLLVQGNFSGSGLGYVVDFTSSSGNKMIQGGGGQATITGMEGNNPFTQLTFGLESGATFTKAIVNPDASIDGHITFIVDYLTAAGSPFTQMFDLSGSGQNFFGIEAGDGARITQVSFNTTDSTFVNAAQFRLGGFDGPTSTSTSVPEGGQTLVLLGASLASLGLVRRAFLKRNSSAR